MDRQRSMRVDAYLSSNAMRAMSNSLSLAATVLRFQIVELWYENEQGGYSCTYVHATEDVVRQHSIIVGYFPDHTKEHVVSPKLCKLSKESPTRCHWNCVDRDRANPLYDVFGFPVLTEMAYVVEGRSDGPNVFIVAFSCEIIERKESRIKFLFGLGYAISVAVFDFEEDESDEERDVVGDELDVKKFVPARPLVATPMPSAGNISSMNPAVSTAELGLGIWGKNLSDANLQALAHHINTPRSARAVSYEDFAELGMPLNDSPLPTHRSTRTDSGQHPPPSTGVEEEDDSIDDGSSPRAQVTVSARAELMRDASANFTADGAPLQPQPPALPIATAPTPTSPPPRVTVPLLQLPTGLSQVRSSAVSNPTDSSASAVAPPPSLEGPDSASDSHNNDTSRSALDTARSVMDTSRLASIPPTWDPAAPFSFPVKEIPPKQTLYDDLTMDSFSDIKHLADGSNANIFLGRLRGQKVIVKMIKASVHQDPVSVHEFDVEHGLLCRLSHPNIIRILGAGLIPRRFIVLEHLGGGTLNTILSQNVAKPGLASRLFRKPTFTYQNLLRKARDMADALDYIHRRAHPGACILHRDLKPDNVGFTSDGVLKLFDFGLATCVRARSTESEAYEMTGFTGSLRYMAPESALRKPYSEKVDVYSFGILVWQMARDRIPFKGLGKEEFLRTVSAGGERPKLDSSWPPAFSQLLTRCWSPDPHQRPTFAQVIEELDRMIHGETMTTPQKAKPLRGALIKGSTAGEHNSTWF